MTTASVEAQALALLSWLIQNFGANLVMSIFGVMTGTAEGMLIEDVSIFVSSVLSAIRSQVDDDRLRALLEAEYVAADAAVDAVEAKKFPAP